MENQTSKQTVAIIGEGAYGSALGTIMTANGHTVRFFDQNPPETASRPAPSKPKYPPLTEVLQDATAVVLAIPSQFVPDFLANFPAEYKNLPFISAVKGILNPKVFAGFPQLSLLSGPAFAEELAEQKPTTLTATGQIAIDLLSTDWLQIELTYDLVGVLACGALKNCYAIGAGYLELQPGTDIFDQYIAKCLNELKHAIRLLGGDPKTADLACGIGDLKLTCGSNLSRNYQFGQALLNAAPGQRVRATATTEGLTTLLSLPENLKTLPVLHELILLARNDGNDLDIGNVKPIQ